MPHRLTRAEICARQLAFRNSGLFSLSYRECQGGPSLVWFDLGCVSSKQAALKNTVMTCYGSFHGRCMGTSQWPFFNSHGSCVRSMKASMNSLPFHQHFRGTSILHPRIPRRHRGLAVPLPSHPVLNSRLVTWKFPDGTRWVVGHCWGVEMGLGFGLGFGTYPGRTRGISWKTWTTSVVASTKISAASTKSASTPTASMQTSISCKEASTTSMKASVICHGSAGDSLIVVSYRTLQKCL